MCETCGCSDTAKPRLVDVTSGQVLHSHSHSHTHSQDHAHDHSHDHEHTHVDEHGNEYVHSHSHDHDSHSKIVTVEKDLLAKNDALAAANRMWLRQHSIAALNFVSSPGSGKTTLLEKTIKALGADITITVLEGDQETTVDAERISSTGCKVLQINTGAGCHLEADIVGRGMQALELPDRSLLVIENVGNLVCPALFDLGEHHKVVVLSVTEGEDKPLKYSHMFRAADIMILNKIDLLPFLDFNVDACVANALSVNSKLKLFKLSATKGDGMDEWLRWLRQFVEKNAKS